MGLFICDICGFECCLGGNDSFNHKCNLEDIKKHVKDLTEQASDDRRNVEGIRDAIEMLLKDVPSLDGEEVTVKTEWLKRLYNASYGGKPYKDVSIFLREWIVVHRILCEAFDLFRTKTKGQRSKTVLKKLSDLKEACEVANKCLKYESEFDVEPKDIIKGGFFGKLF